MPLITTHNYFSKDVLNKCKSTFRKKFNTKENIYELFAQGFDLFRFYEFFHIKKLNLPDYFHENNTDLFFLNYIKIMKERDLRNNPEILAALYGHLTHYILDSNCHPFIVYKTGIYDPSIKETIKYNGKHTNMEMQIDAYLYEKRNKMKFKNFQIHKKLITREKFSKDLLDLLNSTYQQTFNFKNGGYKYQKGRNIMYYSYKILIEDKTGIKKKIYKIVDKLTRKKEGVYEYYNSNISKIDENIFNKENKTWYNPWFDNIKHQDSFFELYDKALNECVILFEKTDLFINNKISENEYKKYLKDYSYVTGLSWKEKTTLKCLEF